MVGHNALPKLEAANAFRHGLFQCFFEPDPAIRQEALKAIGHVVEFWTHSWLEYHCRTPISPMRTGRPPLARHSSSGSGFSNPTGTILRRDSTLMQFDDLFGVDGDDVFNNGYPRRKDSTTGETPDRDEPGWSVFSGECAVSLSDTSSYPTDLEFRFSNRGLGIIDFSVAEVSWAGKLVADESWGVEQMRINLEDYFTWLLRFSVDCVYKDVRKGCQAILQRAERAGAQLPIIPPTGPSVFVPLCDTIGLDYPEPAGTPTATPSEKSPSPLDTPSDDDDEGNISSRDSFPVGIMIPDRQRSRSKGRMPIASSIGRTTRRAAASLISSLFQTPPSPGTGGKFKRRANGRRTVSKYFPKAKEPSDEVRALQMQTYARTGRINNFNKVLFQFPKFAEINRRVTDLFLSDDSMDGPLPQTWRIYLGVIAAAEKRCQYFQNLLSEKLLTVGGPVEWLKGIQYCPTKLQRIANLNKALAHVPWTVSSDDISYLVHSDNGLESRWSVSEVVEAILVLSFYHGKSALALAWGVLPEADLLGGTVKTSTPVAPFGSFAPSVSLSADMASEPTRHPKNPSDSGMKGGDGSFLGLMGRKRAAKAVQHDTVPERWRTLSNGSAPASSTAIYSTSSPKILHSLEPTEAEDSRPTRVRTFKRRKSFDECGTSDELASVSAASLSSSAPNSNPLLVYSAMSGGKPLSMLKDHILSPSSSTSSIFDLALASIGEQANTIADAHSKFISEERLTAGQLDPNRSDYEVLSMEEFSWDNASCIFGSYLDSCVDLLDDYFRQAMDADSSDDGLFESPPAPSPTPITIPNTRSVNEAAWYYSLRLVNIQKDDFRYSDIKLALESSTRRYLKRICIQPELVSAADWIGVQGMNTEEKCRMGLLVTQARFLGEMLWGVKAVSDFLC